MSEHSTPPSPGEPPQRLRYKVVILELEPGDTSFEGNDEATGIVEARMWQVSAVIQGAKASVDVVRGDASLIDPDANRDHEAEARIADRVRAPLAKVVEDARARDHLRKAGEELSEAARIVSIQAHIRVEAELRDAYEGIHSLWKTYVPGHDEVVRSLITKAIEYAVVVTIVTMAAKLAS